MDLPVCEFRHATATPDVFACAHTRVGGFGPMNLVWSQICAGCTVIDKPQKRGKPPRPVPPDVATMTPPHPAHRNKPRAKS